ncbi:type I polyketide synthase [Allostreptomyces psammosilenae]|uniref:Thioester reductase-like protein n=1 Tax=Allostreptomyces psammosilenae TaxID=1892865 RepID=A0A852ZT93_9ACTN|nr:type I polyketide synthase [Allostreptomyces psammosilenae]NYI04014.1 thioester reductase-like protein [Allostreptomyces psammosilenae]
MTTSNERTGGAAQATAPGRQDVLRRALAELKATRAELALAKQARHEPLAVVGIGCRLPGGVRGVEQFWDLLTEGRSGIVEVPADRWDVDEFYDPDPEAAGRTYTRHGGFVDGIREFDPGLFGIPPREAVSIDPQHRMVLEVAWEALEHAGVAPDSLRGSATGVFMGMGGSDYERLGLSAGDHTMIDAYSATGNAANFGANRLSYVLGLEGPSMVVDTACSSSLVALHLACQALRAGECDLALAGGVSLLLAPDTTLALASGRMLSPEGQCKTFDASADGYVRGEGCGVVVLKRLSTAVEAGDEILAVIRGSAVNQDGKSSGLTVPRSAAQQAVVRRALSVGGVAPSEVGYVEAHGTGTSLGDPIEVRALGRVLGEGRSEDNPVALGSVKTNIGHLEAAAGVAGFIKAVLVVQRGQIPPHLNLEEPNPHVAWDELPVTVPTELTEWNDARRVAGISAFGFGGTNAHMVIESPPAPAEPAERPELAGPVLVKVAATGAEALRSSAAALATFVEEGTDLDLAEVAWAAGVGRAELNDRAAVVAGSLKELATGLRAVAAGEDTAGVARGRRPAGSAPRLGFVVPEPSPAIAGALHGLYGQVPAITEAVDALAPVLGPVTELPLKALVEPGDEAARALATEEVGRPALYALAVALGSWWRSVGVEPDLTTGHGAGAYAAAALAGVFPVEDGARLVTALDLTEESFEGVTLRVPEVVFVSDTTGAPVGDEIATADYWLRHAQYPARPADALRALVERGTRTLVELGTGELLALAGQAAAAAGADTPVTLASATSDGPEQARQRLLESLARVWAEGADVDWTRVNPRPARAAKLPSYPFQRRTYWLPTPERPAATAARPGVGDGQALRPRLLETATGEVIGETELSLRLLPFLAEHRVHGRIVVPGVVYLELVLRSAEQVFDGPVGIEDLTLSRPLVLSDDDTRTVQVVIEPAVSGKTRVSVHSKDPQTGWHPHLSAVIVAGDGAAEPTEGAGTAFADARERCTDSVDHEEFYRRAWHPSFALGPSFQLVERAERGPGVAVGLLVPPDPACAGIRAGIRPDLLLLDACVQMVALAGFAQPESWDERPVHLGTGYESMVVHDSVVAGPVWCTAVTREATDGSLTGDLLLTTEDGALVARMRGVSFRAVTPAMLDRMISAGTSGGAAQRATGSGPDVAQLLAADETEATRRIQDHLVRLLAAVLGSAPEDIDLDVPVTVAADSLMLAELKSAVDKDFDIALPMEVIFDDGRLPGLASWILDELRELAPQPEEQEEPAPAAPAADAPATQTETETAPAPAPTPAAEPQPGTPATAPAATAPAAPAAARPARGRRSRVMTVEQMAERAELDASFTVKGEPEPEGTAPESVLLTGSTGFVGAFLLADLLERTGGDVHCLVRAEDEAHARRRLLGNLEKYNLDVGENASRIVPVLGDLAEPRMGIGEQDFTDLHARIGSIFHCGAIVKWTYPYRALEAPNVQGTREALRLATVGAPRPVHFISTVGVFSSKEFTAETVTETDDMMTSGPLVVGYAQSKWVAEKMVRNAHAQGLPVTIHRVNTAGHSVTGAFNRLDHLSLIIKGCAEAGIAPTDVNMALQPAPIDYVSKAIVTLAGKPEANGGTFHLVNDNHRMTWGDFFGHIEDYGFPMERLPFAEWKDRVTSRDVGTMALFGLAPFLNDAVDDVRLPRSEDAVTRAALEGTGVECPPLDAQLIRTYLDYFIECGFMDGPGSRSA